MGAPNLANAALERVRPRLYNADKRSTTGWQHIMLTAWRARWPTRTRDQWWRLASGAAYLAASRRYFRTARLESAYCKYCMQHATAELDTPEHAYLHCPLSQPLWRWARGRLRAVGECQARRHQDRAHFLLYGILPPDAHQAAHAVNLPQDATGAGVVTHIWGHINVAGFATTRICLLNPQSTSLPDPCMAVNVARTHLRAVVIQDHGHALGLYSPRAPTKYEALGDVELDEARMHTRPITEASFNAKWRFLAVSNQGSMHML